MANLTDPAAELADIAKRLTNNTNASGEKFLSDQFGVEAWSTNFVKIMACILERADQVSNIIKRSGMDADHRNNALSDLAQFKSGFAGGTLRQPWSSHGMTLMKDHGRPLQYLSTVVRAQVSYPKLTDEEVQEFLGLIDAYLAELQESDEDLGWVRQAIMDGLNTFKFQLEHIGWLGSAYTLAAFREVMFVYEASKRQFGGAKNPDAGAFLKGLSNIVTSFKKKIDDAQGWADTGKTILNAYQLTSSAVMPLLLTGTIQLPK